MEYNITLLGDGGVGKTAWIRRIISNTFEPRYYASVGCEVHTIDINTNHGTFVLNLYDYAGQEKYSHSPLVTKSDATILMFDLTSRISYMNLNLWNKKCLDEPVFVIGNKCDIKDNDIKVVPSVHQNYLSLSAKKMTFKVFITPILRRLTGHLDLLILE